MAMLTTAATVHSATDGDARFELELATSFWRRGVGLLGRRKLPPATGLLLDPCSSVHMFGMVFAIDVVYLDRDGRVVKVAPHLRPWRMSRGGRGARAAIELAAGEAQRLGIVPGAVISY